MSGLFSQSWDRMIIRFKAPSQEKENYHLYHTEEVIVRNSYNSDIMTDPEKVTDN